MKLLLTVVCLVGTTLAVPINTRQKRDILPGDPRFGTDYHHQHHHHHENEVEVTKAVGGYAGTYTEQLPQQQYGPPFYQPGQPLKDYVPVVEDVKKTVEQTAPVQTVQQIPQVQKVEQTVEIPNGSYGAPLVQQPEVIQNAQAVKQTAPLSSYGTPVQNYEQVQSVQQLEPVQEVQPAQQIQQVEPVQTIERVEPVRTVQQVESLPTFENVQPLQPVQQVQPQPFQTYGPPLTQSPVRVQQTVVQPIRQVQPVYQVQPVKQVQRVQQVQPVKQVQYVQQTLPVKQVQQVQRVQQVQQPQPQAFNTYLAPQAQQIVKVQETPQVAPVLPEVAPVVRKIEVHSTPAPLVQDHVHFQRTQTFQPQQVKVEPARQSFNAVPLSYQPATSGYSYPSAPLHVHQLPAPIRQVQYQTPVQVQHVQPVEYQTPVQVQHVQQVEQYKPVQVHRFQQQYQQTYPSFQEVKNYQVPQVQRGYLSPEVQQTTFVQQPAVQETVSFDTPVQSIEVPFSSQSDFPQFPQVPQIPQIPQVPQFPNIPSFGDSVQIVDAEKKVKQPAQVLSQGYAQNGGYAY